MRTINQYATPLWWIPPLLSCDPPTKSLTDPSTAQACMRTPTLAGRLLTTAPTLCPEDLPCWDVHQRVIFTSLNSGKLKDSHYPCVLLTSLWVDSRRTCDRKIMCDNRWNLSVLILIIPPHACFTVIALLTTFLFCYIWLYLVFTPGMLPWFGTQ